MGGGAALGCAPLPRCGRALRGFAGQTKPEPQIDGAVASARARTAAPRPTRPTPLRTRARARARAGGAAGGRRPCLPPRAAAGIPSPSSPFRPPLLLLLLLAFKGWPPRGGPRGAAARAGRSGGGAAASSAAAAARARAAERGGGAGPAEACPFCRDYRAAAEFAGPAERRLRRGAVIAAGETAAEAVLKQRGARGAERTQGRQLGARVLPVRPSHAARPFERSRLFGVVMHLPRGPLPRRVRRASGGPRRAGVVRARRRAAAQRRPRARVVEAMGRGEWVWTFGQSRWASTRGSTARSASSARTASGSRRWPRRHAEAGARPAAPRAPSPRTLLPLQARGRRRSPRTRTLCADSTARSLAPPVGSRSCRAPV